MRIKTYITSKIYRSLHKSHQPTPLRLSDLAMGDFSSRILTMKNENCLFSETIRSAAYIFTMQQFK